MRSLVALFLAAAPAVAADPPAGFHAVFNGKDLKGWTGWAIHEKDASFAALDRLSKEDRTTRFERWTEDAMKHWSVENGELVNDGGGAYLATEKLYGDVEFLIEYKTVAKADSGIYMRATPQVQIWDSTDPTKFNLGANLGSGGLWNNAKGANGKDPLEKADKPFGEWNSFRIVQVGERTTVYLNDKLVVKHARLANYFDKTAPLPKQAPILLQTHGGEIRWRNVFAREIPAAEANDLLAKEEADGFAKAFTGTDLTGWAGATDNYEVIDGAIRCKPKKGGVLHTTAEYADFVARVEFQLPPGGNNGLAIRYPGGTGDGAYIGMTELQVLDDSAAQYKSLDNRQYHGSAYGMAAAARGYQRPVGEWNFQEVTVKGSTIRVELNGTVILDTDLAKVTDYMGGKPHPGKDRTTGFFGFCGHGDAVAFRNVMIRAAK